MPLKNLPVRWTAAPGLRLSLLLASLAAAVPEAAADPTTPTAAPTLIVANAQGVQEVDYLGKVVRRLSALPAAEPRYVAGKKQVVFLHRRTEGAQLELYILELDSSAARRIARIPELQASQLFLGPGPHRTFLDMDPAADTFLISGNSAHLLLAQSGGDEVDLEAEFTVNLSSGQVRQERIGCSTANCRPGLGGVQEKLLKRPSRASAAGPSAVPPVLPYCPKEPPFLYRGASGLPEQGSLLTKGSRTKWQPLPAGRSPSGRWLGLERSNGDDYGGRWVALLDCQTGSIYPVESSAEPMGKTSPWPEPMSAAQLRDPAQLSLTTFTSHEQLRWRERDDLLIAGTTLVRPGQALVALGGQAAF